MLPRPTYSSVRPLATRPLHGLLRGGAVLALALAAACSGAGAGADVDQTREHVGEQGSAINPISGCDYSFARPSPASLVSMGYTFAARYLSGDPSSGKDISASEASALEAAGMDVVLVFESTGMDATSGYNQGVSDAQAAKSEAAAVGEPATRPIYFAIDFDAQSSDAASINSYFQGVASVLGLSRTGVYGGYYIVNELFNAGLVTFAWQTYAWSGGSWDSRAQLRQTQNGVDGDQLDADEGVAADFGQWGPNAPSGTADYAAQFVSQSFPLAATALPMVSGQTIPSYIELKNVGTKTWDSNTHLGTTVPRDRNSVFADSTWLAPNRPAGVTGTVAPGATFKFQFDLHAPATAGTYNEYFGVVQEGVAWFSDPGQGGPVDNDLEVQVVVTAPEYAASFVSQTYPLAPNALKVNAGDEVQGSITLKNTGTKPWVSGSVKLAPIPRDVASPFATSSWLSPTRASTVPADVQPGATGTFPLSLKASTVGAYSIGFGLLDETVTWFSDAPAGGGPADGFLKVDLTVVAAGAPDGGGVVHVDGGATSDDGGSLVDDAGFPRSDAATVDAGRAHRDGGQGVGRRLDGGPGVGSDGAAGQVGSDGGEDAGDTMVAGTGGCRVAGGEPPPVAGLAIAGLAFLIGRRRRASR